MLFTSLPYNKRQQKVKKNVSKISSSWPDVVHRAAAAGGVGGGGGHPLVGEATQLMPALAGLSP